MARGGALSRAEEIRRQVNAAFKSEVLTMASDDQFIVRYMPTGLLPIDVLLKGGLPRGRFTTVIGDWSTLKSYIGYCTIARAQERGEVCALIDTERAFDPAWAATLGINRSELIMPPKDMLRTGEQAVDYAEVLIQQGVDLIVFDSVAAALPQAERTRRLTGESQQMARLATLMSRAMRKLTSANSTTAVLWINQIRMNVGITFGNPETPTGGKALPYFSSYILEVKKIGKETRSIKSHDGDKEVDAKEVIAQKFRATLTKSKLSKPLRDVLFDWSFEQGGRIDVEKFLFAQGIEHGVVQQIGKSRWQVKGSRNVVNGRPAFINHLAKSDADRAKLEEMVLRAHDLTELATSPGNHGPASKKVVRAKSSRPSGAASSSTRTPARVASKPMRRTLTKSTSTKTPSVRTLSKPAT